MDNYRWDIFPDMVRIQYLCGRSTENVRIVLQYEYCRKLLSSTSGKTLYFTVILPRVREKLSLSQLVIRVGINGHFAHLSQLA